jgi:hypothetical protein
MVRETQTRRQGGTYEAGGSGYTADFRKARPSRWNRSRLRLIQRMSAARRLSGGDRLMGVVRLVAAGIASLYALNAFHLLSPTRPRMYWRADLIDSLQDAEGRPCRPISRRSAGLHCSRFMCTSSRWLFG